MELVNDVIQRSLPNIFIIGLNALFLWGLWSVRKIFVRHEECKNCRAELQAFEQRFEKQSFTYTSLEQRLHNAPTAKDLHAMSLELAQLRGEQACIMADIKSLHAILKRIEQPLTLLMQEHLKA